MNNVVVIGFMGSGKSTVGPLLAARLGRPFLDLDQAIAAGAGRSVQAIFDGEGEAAFRRREAGCLAEALRPDGRVVAVGGGAPLAAENWARIREGNTVVALTAEPEELVGRLRTSTDRPLLRADLPAAIATLLPRRAARYLEADLVLPTDGRSAEAVADELARRLPPDGIDRVAVNIPGARHEVTIGRRLAHLLGPALRRAGVLGTVVITTDPVLEATHVAPIMEALRAAGYIAQVHRLPAGEAAKSMGTLSGLYDRLAALGVDRDGALLVLGGGTVGDLSGFAAATWLRGIRYLQVPTTLLAMVDSSIGGKTAINLDSGKNLVGALHEPVAIFCDLEYLAGLPEEEFRSGMAEVCKVAIVADPAFAQWLQASAAALRCRQPAALREAVRRAAAIKACVVAEDPDESGRRAILNYGHTIGHGLERALGYGMMRHGEAVAWGMEVAAALSVATARCTPEVARTQTALLRAHGLLATRPMVERQELLAAIQHDKKTRQRVVRWVLLRRFGETETGCQVEPEQLAGALDKVLG